MLVAAVLINRELIYFVRLWLGQELNALTKKYIIATQSILQAHWFFVNGGVTLRKIYQSIGMSTEMFCRKDRKFGIDGEFLEVFVSRKSGYNE